MQRSDQEMFVVCAVFPDGTKEFIWKLPDESAGRGMGWTVLHDQAKIFNETAADELVSELKYNAQRSTSRRVRSAEFRKESVNVD